MSEFVQASKLYNVGSRTPIAHPAHQASDADVQRALEQREVRTDGGQSLSGTEHTIGDQDLKCRDWVPALQANHVASNTSAIRPRGGSKGTYEAISGYGLNWYKPASCLQVLPEIDDTDSWLSRKLHAATDRSVSDSENSNRTEGGEPSR